MREPSHEKDEPGRGFGRCRVFMLIDARVGRQLRRRVATSSREWVAERASTVRGFPAGKRKAGLWQARALRSSQPAVQHGTADDVDAAVEVEFPHPVPSTAVS
jgi:hypothetical protein